MSHVEAICISVKKGTVKLSRPEVTFKEGWGIEGDAHGGKWHRQISLLAGESIDQVREILPQLADGAFGENLVTRGVDVAALAVGDRLQVGAEAILEVTQIGKACHNGGCPIKQATGDCIMPREGIFCRVIEGGAAKPGDGVTVLERLVQIQ